MFGIVPWSVLGGGERQFVSFCVCGRQVSSPWWSNHIRVLPLAVFVARTEHGSAVAVALYEWSVRVDGTGHVPAVVERNAFRDRHCALTSI